MPYSVRVNRSGTTGSLNRTTSLPPIASFTVMAWVFTQSGNTTTNNIFGLGSSTSGGVFYGLQFNVGPLSLWNGSTNVDSVNTYPGGWAHLAMVVAGTGASQFTAYVNGKLDITHAGNATVAAQKLFLGNDNATAGEAFFGNFCAIKIYDRALTVSEINLEMQFVLPAEYAGLNSAYPIPSEWDLVNTKQSFLPRGVTNRWDDWSGFNREWTESGTIDMEPGGPPIQFAPAMETRHARIQKPAAGAFTPKQRRTLGEFGTRVGGRSMRAA